MAERAGGTMTPKTDDPAILREHIAQTRDEMARTVNAIEERLSPAHLKEQVETVKEHVVDQLRDAKENIKQDIAEGIQDAKSRVRQATVGKVENMVKDTRETVTEAGASVVETLKANPVPTALVAVGLGWLWMSSRRGSAGRAGTGGQFASRAQGRGGYGYGEVIDRTGPTIAQAGHRVKESAEHLAEGAEQALHDVGDAASTAVHYVGDRATSLAQDARVTGRRVAASAGTQLRRAEWSIESMLRENPLAFGAVAIAIGAAIGLSLPHTAKEDQIMGAAKERLVDKAQGVAGHALQQVEEKVAQLTGGEDDKEQGDQAEEQGQPSSSMQNGIASPTSEQRT